MSVTLFEDQGGYGYYESFINAENLENYYMSLFSDWNDEVSALYVSYGFVNVYEDAYGGGDSATLTQGFWDLDDLEALGIDNDSISSFYSFV